MLSVVKWSPLKSIFLRRKFSFFSIIINIKTHSISCMILLKNLPSAVTGPKTVSSSTVLQFHRRFLNWCLHSCESEKINKEISRGKKEKKIRKGESKRSEIALNRFSGKLIHSEFFITFTIWSERWFDKFYILFCWSLSILK